MSTLYTVIVAIAAVFNLGSGILTMLRVRFIFPLFDGAGIPHSWAVFPIGTFKALGGLGLVLGLLGVPWIGLAASIGLVLFWTCAIYTHFFTRFWPPQSVFTFVFFSLSAGSLSLGLFV
ncbi:DoxX family protein [Glycomyces tenuis]|uniref:DoxX family protein n=1 Tax=Glycomyces tenuis TaxID=58116 RepID=UPI0004109A38|nr:DoxX family protein [Glycomyces tenuis]